jgi:hypothetical protein
MKPISQPLQVTGAYLVAGFLFLAGFAEIIAGLLIRTTHQAAFISVGAVLWVVGALWLAIAARLKRKLRGSS